jgi:hypothetical protein
MLAAYNVAAAVNEHMTIVKPEDHKTLILHEDLFKISDYHLDYAGGKGIFMRNLQVLNARSHGDPGDIYDALIKANATAVWNSRRVNNKFRYFWNAEAPEPTYWGYDQSVSDTVVHASGLSALTAALPWFADQQIATAPVPALENPS